MKFLISVSTVIFLMVLSVFELSVSSCTKDHTIYDTVTVVRKDTVTVTRTDTVTIRDTVLTIEILTAHAWKIQELRGVMQNLNIYYLRGSSTNVINYDNEYLLFNSDKTGTYVDANSASRSLTWDFNNLDSTKITFIIYNTPATFPINWENIRYKNNSLYYDEYYTDGNTGYNWHGQGLRIPK